MTEFTGTGSLIRFILRRDRVRIPIWIVAIFITTIGTAAVFPDTYPTAEDRQARASLMENPALRLLTGPAHGLEDYTFGAMMASEMLGMMTIIVALMSIFMVVRHTRTEEETGRAELVRASVVGRHAGMTAALAVTAGVNLIIGITTALGASAVLDELYLSGSLLFGASMVVTGVTFAAIAAVSVQINEFARAATGLSIAVLAVAYVLRGFGDMLENALSWFPPFGLALQTAPYVEDRWWPLGILLVLSAALVPLAFSLSTRRDVAAALRQPRPGPAHASSVLMARFGMVLRLQRGSLLAWGAGLVLFGVGVGAMVSDVGEMYVDNPMVADYFAALGLDLEQVTDSVLAMYVMYFALIASIYTVSTITRLRGEETSLRAENVLATAVSRVRWAGESVAFGIVTSTMILFLTGVAAGLMHASVVGDMSEAWPVVVASLTYAPGLWIAAAIAVTIYGLFPRAMALAWFVPAYGFFALMIGPLLGLPEWLYNLSPFEQIPRVPSVAFDVVPLLVITAISMVLIAAGLYGIRRRDLDFT